MKCVCKTVLVAVMGVVLTGNAMIPLPGNQGSVEVERYESEDTLRITYRLPHVSTAVTSDGYTRVTQGKLQNLNSLGKPRIPTIPLRIAVPELKEVKSFLAAVTREDTLTFPNPIEPGVSYLAPHEIEEGTVQKLLKDESIYNSDKLWPESSIRSNGTMYKRGNPILSFQLFPIRYLPSQSSIFPAREITVTVIWKEKRATRGAETELNRRPLDSAAIEIINSPAPVAEPQSRSGTAQYLAITTEILKQSSREFNLQKLLAKHNERGLSTKLLTVEEITGKYDGVDTQEKIRNAIIDHYNTAGTEYVLLAGDASVIPVRQFYMNEAPYSNFSSQNKQINITTDLYYSCLDGNHNFDGDTLWGESTDGPDGSIPDMLSEVYLGRFPVETVEELSNIVQKTLIHLNGGTAEKILFAGEHLGFGGISEHAKPSMEEVWFGGAPTSYYTRGFVADPHLERDTIYAGAFPKDGYGVPQWKAKDIGAKLNTNQFGIVNHLGHGLEILNMKFWVRPDTFIVNDNSVNEIANTVPYFVNSQACLSGRYEKETISEYLTIGTHYGAWGGIWNSNWGLGEFKSTDSPSQFMQRQFWHAYFGKEIKEVGKMSVYADETAAEKAMYDWGFRWVAYVTHLTGDPAAPIGISNGRTILEIDSFTEGTIWEQGHTFPITWYDNFDENVNIELVQNGETVYTIAESVPSIHSYDWTVAEDVPLGGPFTIRVSGVTNGISDESALITIDPKSQLNMLFPLGGEEFEKGETISIQWDDDIDESVSIYLYHKGQERLVIAEGLESSTNSYDWRIPQYLFHDGRYQIRIESDIKPWLHAINGEGIEFTAPAINSFPYEDNFNSYEKNSKEIGFWAQVPNGPNDDFDWLVYEGATPSKNQADDWWNTTGPSSDVSGNGKYIYCEGTGNQGGNIASLFSPALNLKNKTNVELSLKFHLFNKEDYGNMGMVGIFLLVNGKWENPILVEGSQGDQWIEKKVNLTELYGNLETTFIYIQAATGKSFASDMALDELKITADDGEVSVVEHKFKEKQNDNFAVFPAVLEEGDLSITAILDDVQAHETVTYKIFDVVGNRLIHKTGIYSGDKSWQLPLPASLARGMYLLQVTVDTVQPKQYKAIIGKKE